MATQFDKFKERNNFKMNLIQDAELVGRYDFPKLRLSKYLPKEIIPFNYAKTEKHPQNKCIHFFIDDFQFERIWNYPNKYLELFKKFEGIITPDFSMYSNMPSSQRIWNCYRNRTMAFWMQRNGIEIVPTVEWACFDELDWCLDGIPIGSNIAIGTYGCLISSLKRYELLKGIERITKTLHPNTVIFYGSEIKSIYGLCEKAVFFENYCNMLKKRLK